MRQFGRGPSWFRLGGEVRLAVAWSFRLPHLKGGSPMPVIQERDETDPAGRGSRDQRVCPRHDGITEGLNA